MAPEWNPELTTPYKSFEEPSAPQKSFSSIAQKTISAIRDRTLKTLSRISSAILPPSKAPISDDVYRNMDETPSVSERVSSITSAFQEVFNPLQEFLETFPTKELPDETSDAIYDIAAKKMSRQINDLSHRLCDVKKAPHRSPIENLGRSLYQDYSPKKIDELKKALQETAKNYPLLAEEGIALINEKIEKLQDQTSKQSQVIADTIKVYEDVRSCLEIASSPN